MIFKIPLSGGSLILPLSFPQALSREFESPLERWPSMISTNRPEIESWPHEFLLQVMDREAWHAAIHGIQKSWIERLN